MRIVDPARFEPRDDVESILTAMMPSYVVTALQPAMKDVDPFNSPGPAKIAALQTEIGSTMFIVYHEEKKLLEILGTIDAHVIDNLSEVLTVLRIPPTAIEWLHPRLPQADLLARELLPLRKILVIEDNPVAQSLLLELLESNGYAVSIVSSLEAVGHVLITSAPDVILLDPAVIDPASLSRSMKERAKDIPIVVIGDIESHAELPLTKAGLLDALAETYAGVTAR